MGIVDFLGILDYVVTFQHGEVLKGGQDRPDNFSAQNIYDFLKQWELSISNIEEAAQDCFVK